MVERKPSTATATKLAKKKAVNKPVAKVVTKKPTAKKKPVAKVEPVFPLLVQKEMLAMLGTAQTAPMAPWEDDKFEIWAVGQCATFPWFKRGDILFELHTRDYWDDKSVKERLNKWNGRLMMQDHYKEIPKSERFPIEAILQYRRYHTTSISYMLAAAYHSFKLSGKPFHIGLFGIHMEDIREEYAEQRPCCEYWLARMEEAGMDVFIAGGSVLAAPFLYGYENYNPLCYLLRQRLDGLQQGVNVLAQQEDALVRQKHEQIGGVKEAEVWLRKAQRGEISIEAINALEKKKGDT